MTLNVDKMVILRIAKDYYLDRLSQQEIADKENIHRSQISRILKMAREMGFVSIKIAAPEDQDLETLSEQLCSSLKLDDVFIAPSLSSEGNPDESLYFFAARRLEEVLLKSRRIGIGLGKTLYHTASQLTKQSLPQPPDFYSIVGTSGTDNTYLQAGVLLDSFAKPFGGACHYNNFPICINRKLMTDLDLNRHNELLQSYSQLDTVVLSVGGPLNIDYPYLEEVSFFGKEIDTSKAFSRPHGNLLGHVFYDDHEILKMPENYMMTSMDLQTLQQIPNVIAIASGLRKADAIISAASQNYIKSLITDEATAREIIKRKSSVLI